MKSKKLSLADFKQNKLKKDDAIKVKAGAPINPPPIPPQGNGGGTSEGEEICYYDFEGVLLYCVPNDPKNNISN